MQELTLAEKQALALQIACEIDRVCREAHGAMVRMAGIEVNPWPWQEEEG